jgi:hypothetical protein
LARRVSVSFQHAGGPSLPTGLGPSLQTVQIQSKRAGKLPFRTREEFRAPAGVRKSPRKEPAGHERRLWGLPFSAGVSDDATAVGKRGDGCGQSVSLRLRAALSTGRVAYCGSVGFDDHHGWVRLHDED